MCRRDKDQVTMGDDDKLSAILMQVGETKGKVDAISGDVATIKSRMQVVVTRGECTGKHKLLEQSLARTMTEVKEDLRQGIKDIKKGSEEHPCITPAMLAAAVTPHELTPAEMEAVLAARAYERAEKRRKLVAWYVGTALAVCGLLGVLGGAVYKVVVTLDKVQSVVAAQPAEMRRQLQSSTQVVYVPMPIIPDAPVEPVAPRRPQKLPGKRPR